MLGYTREIRGRGKGWSKRISWQRGGGYDQPQVSYMLKNVDIGRGGYVMVYKGSQGKGKGWIKKEPLREGWNIWWTSGTCKLHVNKCVHTVIGGYVSVNKINQK